MLLGSGQQRLRSTCKKKHLQSAFFWLDIFGGDGAARTDLLNQLRLEAADVNWMQRFGQTSRMTFGRRGLRAVTWLVGRRGVS